MSETPEMIDRVARAMWEAHEEAFQAQSPGSPRWEFSPNEMSMCEARAAIAAHRAALQEAGLVIVPREASGKMLEAARDWSLKKYGQGYNHDRAAFCGASNTVTE